MPFMSSIVTNVIPYSNCAHASHVVSPPVAAAAEVVAGGGVVAVDVLAPVPAPEKLCGPLEAAALQAAIIFFKIEDQLQGFKVLQTIFERGPGR